MNETWLSRILNPLGKGFYKHGPPEPEYETMAIISCPEDDCGWWRTYTSDAHEHLGVTRNSYHQHYREAHLEGKP